MKRIKLENDDVLSFEQNAELESKICTLYKDGSCQVLSKEMHGSLVPISEGKISFVGRTCDDCIGLLCGWYPVRRSMTMNNKCTCGNCEACRKMMFADEMSVMNQHYMRDWR